MAGQQHTKLSSLLMLLLILQGSLLAAAADTKAAPSTCKQTSACFFDCGNKVMDLTALKNTIFKDVMDSKGQNRFSYKPCGTFDEGSGCHNTHVCQVVDPLDLDKNNTADVGTQLKVVSFFPSTMAVSDHNALIYAHSTPDKTKRTTVTLQCASANDVMANALTVQGENPAGSGQYGMTLRSQHACFQAKETTTTPAPATTAGNNKTTNDVTSEKPQPPTTQPAPSNKTEVTTPSTKGNATTEPSPVTTPESANATTASSPSSNVTTAPMTTEPVTTVMTTSAGGNVTTPAGMNVTTTPMLMNTTTALNNENTTMFVTTEGQSTHGVMTTPSGADTPRMVLASMLLAAVAAWNGL